MGPFAPNSYAMLCMTSPTSKPYIILQYTILYNIIHYYTICFLCYHACRHGQSLSERLVRHHISHLSRTHFSVARFLRLSGSSWLFIVFVFITFLLQAGLWVFNAWIEFHGIVTNCVSQSSFLYCVHVHLWLFVFCLWSCLPLAGLLQPIFHWGLFGLPGSSCLVALPHIPRLTYSSPGWRPHPVFLGWRSRLCAPWVCCGCVFGLESPLLGHNFWLYSLRTVCSLGLFLWSLAFCLPPCAAPTLSFIISALVFWLLWILDVWLLSVVRNT